MVMLSIKSKLVVGSLRFFQKGSTGPPCHKSKGTVLDRLEVNLTSRSKTDCPNPAISVRELIHVAADRRDETFGILVVELSEQKQPGEEFLRRSHFSRSVLSAFPFKSRTWPVDPLDDSLRSWTFTVPGW